MRRGCATARLAAAAPRRLFVSNAGAKVPKREGTQASLMGQVVSKRQAEIYWKRHRIDVARSAQLKKQLDKQRGRQ